MAHSKQARRRIVQNEKRRMSNKVFASSMRTAVRKIHALCAAGDREQAQASLPATLSRIDKAAKKGVIHGNAAARKKSQVMRAVAAAGKT